MACVVNFLEQLAYSRSPVPQEVCTTICNVQSSLERTLFVAGRQRVGTVWLAVNYSGVNEAWRDTSGTCLLQYNIYYSFYYTLYTIKFVFCYALENILSGLIFTYSVLTGLFRYRSSEILTLPEENTGIFEGASYYNWQLKCKVQFHSPQ